MSKDVVIAVVIVVACLGLVTVAFVLPRHKPAPTTDIAATDPVVSDYTPTPPQSPTTDPLLGDDPFAPINPINNDTAGLNNNPVTDPFPTPGNSFTPISEYPPTNPPTNANSQPPIGFPPPALPPPQPIDPIPTTPPPMEERTHTVASGETLGEISQKYYNTARNWKKIAEANKVDPSELKVGQKLIIPVIESSTPVVANTSPELAGGERSYTVQKGDSYYQIAKKELGNAARWKEIEKLNGIPAEELRPGKNIKLPAKESAVPTISNGNSTDTSNFGGRVHVVASGETLSDISKKYYGTTTKWKEIVKANPGVDPEGMKVGQKLKIPEISGTSLAPTNAEMTTNVGDTSGTYTVQAGDTTLAKIAEKELGSSKEWPKIVEANPGLDPRKLRIGQKLIIPGKSGNSGTSTPPPTTGFPPPTTGFPPPTNNNSGFGGNNNNGFGGNNNSGFGGSSNNGTPPPNNFGPTNTPVPLPIDNGIGPAPAYPSPTTTTPPSNNPLPPASTLPDSFGGPSGFSNSP
jgi:nucleoid-associated protein YgaU